MVSGQQAIFRATITKWSYMYCDQFFFPPSLLASPLRVMSVPCDTACNGHKFNHDIEYEY